MSKPQSCGDFAEVLHAFEVRLADLDLDRITDDASRLDGATAKRLGWVFEQLGMTSPHLERLLRVPVKGYRVLDPTVRERAPAIGATRIRRTGPRRLDDHTRICRIGNNN